MAFFIALAGFLKYLLQNVQVFVRSGSKLWQLLDNRICLSADVTVECIIFDMLSVLFKES